MNKISGGLLGAIAAMERKNGGVMAIERSRERTDSAFARDAERKRKARRKMAAESRRRNRR